MLSLFITMTVVAGCTPSEGSGTLSTSRVDVDSEVPEGDWPYWPNSMRIHPLTRFVREASTDRLSLELRVEFLDFDGHTSKAFGRVRIDLFDRSGGRMGVTSLATWEADLTDDDVNRARYDVVTRTYLFFLELEEGERPQQPEIRVFYLGADGATLEASALLRG